MHTWTTTNNYQARSIKKQRRYQDIYLQGAGNNETMYNPYNRQVNISYMYPYNSMNNRYHRSNFENNKTPQHKNVPTKRMNNTDTQHIQNKRQKMNLSSNFYHLPAWKKHHQNHYQPQISRKQL